MSRSPHPLDPFLDAQGLIVLDGGLATALEADGHDLNDPLWSARVLVEAPEAISRVHTDYLTAGADCIATASYQATLPGFVARGIDASAGTRLLQLSVELAVEARDQYRQTPGGPEGRLRPLVAASIGPYGAYLANGSEYTGDYGVGRRELDDFHRGRWEILASSSADLLACETIPSQPETEVLLELLEETPETWAWLSFSCRDAAHISDGARLVDVVRACHGVEGVAAVGINCTAPELIRPLIAEAQQGTDKPILVYPNSGESYEPASGEWTGDGAELDWGVAAGEWVKAGAAGVGGCCRVGPDQIRRIRSSLTTR